MMYILLFFTILMTTMFAQADQTNKPSPQIKNTPKVAQPTQENNQNIKGAPKAPAQQNELKKMANNIATIHRETGMILATLIKNGLPVQTNGVFTELQSSLKALAKNTNSTPQVTTSMIRRIFTKVSNIEKLLAKKGNASGLRYTKQLKELSGNLTEFKSSITPLTIKKSHNNDIEENLYLILKKLDALEQRYDKDETEMQALTHVIAVMQKTISLLEHKIELIVAQAANVIEQQNKTE